MISIPQPVTELVDVLTAMPGTVAVVLGGSRTVRSDDEGTLRAGAREARKHCWSSGSSGCGSYGRRLTPSRASAASGYATRNVYSKPPALTI
jgi:hypothetical protein